jgi:hypothetical protein
MLQNGFVQPYITNQGNETSVPEEDGYMAIIGSGEHQVQTSFVFITRFKIPRVQEWLNKTPKDLTLMYKFAVS